MPILSPYLSPHPRQFRIVPYLDTTQAIIIAVVLAVAVACSFVCHPVGICGCCCCCGCRCCCLFLRLFCLLLPLLLGRAGLQPRVKKPSRSDLRSAEGWSEGEAAATDIAFAFAVACSSPHLPQNPINGKLTKLPPKSTTFLPQFVLEEPQKHIIPPTIPAKNLSSPQTAKTSANQGESRGAVVSLHPLYWIQRKKKAPNEVGAFLT